MNAPALEKGLDILENIVAESDALTLSQMAERCGRTVSEIQRMVHVLQRRGYLERTGAGAYRPGLKLYELGRFRHPFRQLQVVAEPLMVKLAEETGHSIHLSVEDRGQMLILSEILGSGLASVALKIGSHHALENTLSGRILLAGGEGTSRPEDEQRLDQKGFLEMPSALFSGIQDIGAPIRRKSDRHIIGVLACSWLKHRKEADNPDKLGQSLIQTANEIAAALFSKTSN